MKHTTSRKKMLISSVAMLLVAMMALGSATFAWFSTKTTAHAEALTASTVQGTNLVISESKTEGWTQDLKFTGTTTATLDPVTPNADLTTWQTAKADSWDAQKVGSNDNALKTVSESGYVLSKIVYVKYDATEGDFNLNVSLDVTTTKGTDKFYRAAIVPITSTTDGDLANATGASTKIYADENNVTDGVTLAYTASSDTENLALGKITANSIYGYKVVIWFEGHDLDCKDSLSTNTIKLALDFGGAKVTTA
jgi:hypothetical protein